MSSVAFIIWFSAIQSAVRHGHGEVVDFDAVELADADLDRVDALQADGDLPVGEQHKHLVFQLADAQIALRQEITAACGGVQPGQCRQLVLELTQLPLLRFGDGDGFDVLQLRFQVVQEQRVDDLVDVLD